MGDTKIGQLVEEFGDWQKRKLQGWESSSDDLADKLRGYVEMQIMRLEQGCSQDAKVRDAVRRASEMLEELTRKPTFMERLGSFFGVERW